jgi:DNA invertase Pin-like site-specific DNA recombinase
MIYGYVRTTQGEQSNTEKEALSRANCTKFFVETPLSLKGKGPALKRCLSSLGSGDTLVVWRLHKLARSLDELVTILAGLSDRGVYFCSVSEEIDTRSLEGRLLVEFFELYAELKRNLIMETTLRGIKKAHAAGRSGGAKYTTTLVQDSEIRSQWNSGQFSIQEIADKYRLSKSTVERRVKHGRRKSL